MSSGRLLSSHAIGKAYERAVYAFVQRPPLSMKNVVQVGSANDRGVDLRAFLSPPLYHATTARLVVPVIVQCKSYASKLGPSVVREIEGTLSATASVGQEQRRTCAIVCSTNGFSVECVRRASGSRMPISLAHLAYATRDDDDAEGGGLLECRGFWMNDEMVRELGTGQRLVLRRNRSLNFDKPASGTVTNRLEWA